MQHNIFTGSKYGDISPTPYELRSGYRSGSIIHDICIQDMGLHTSIEKFIKVCLECLKNFNLRTSQLVAWIKPYMFCLQSASALNFSCPEISQRCLPGSPICLAWENKCWHGLKPKHLSLVIVNTNFITHRQNLDEPAYTCCFEWPTWRGRNKFGFGEHHCKHFSYLIAWVMKPWLTINLFKVPIKAHLEAWISVK